MRLDTIEFQLKAHPAGVAEALLYVRELTKAYRNGMVGRDRLDGTRRMRRADRAIEAALAAVPDKRTDLLTARGLLLRAAGKPDLAIAVFQDAMASGPTVVALESMLQLAEPPIPEVQRLCSRMLGKTTLKTDRFAVMRTCVVHTRARSLKEGLSWAGPEDRIFYRQESARRGLEADALLVR